MKDKEPKIHPLVKVSNLLSIAALVASQIGCKPPPTTPEVIPTGTSPALTVEPPVGFEPLTPTPEGISTATGVETQTPTESDIAPFRAPTLEELVVPAGEGGPLPEYAQGYYNVMDRVKADVVQKVGVDPGKVKIRYWDNTGSHDDFGWMLYYQIEAGGLIWPLKPDGTLADYPAYFEGEVQPDGSLKNLRINSDYNNWVVAGEESAAIFGGTLPVIVDFPVDANVSGETKLVYSRWIRPGGQPADYAKDFSEWQETSGVSEPTPTETLPPLPEEFLSQIPKDSYTYDANGLHITVAEGRVIDIPQDQIAEKFQGKVFILNLNQQSESGYQLGVVFRDNQWRETLLDFPFQTNGENIDNLPTVVLEDITSGRLAEAERLAAEPLPENVVPLTNYYISTNYGYIIGPEPTNDQRAAYYSDEATKPMRYEFFYNTEVNGVPLIISTLQIENPDGSSRFLHGAEGGEYYTPSSLRSHPEYFDDWLKYINLQYMPLFDLSIFDDPSASCDQPPFRIPPDLTRKAICSINQPNREKLEALVQQWVGTGNIPEEFERVIYTIGSVRW